MSETYGRGMFKFVGNVSLFTKVGVLLYISTSSTGEFQLLHISAVIWPGLLFTF